jgi:8-oxo-dGTP pyrophosphatase MutT (NUDIX family)
MSDESAIARWCAAALLVAPDGRYLMQLRDDKPTIIIPDHWCLFGGTVEAGETAEAALRRELLEELELAPRAASLFTELRILLPFAPPRIDRMTFFAVPLDWRDLDAMVQHEGAGRRLFTAAELAAEPRMAPWDAAAVLMHARSGVLFAPPPPMSGAGEGRCATVVAILIAPDGRYLMQLRDDKPTITIPAHWCLFGGAVEPGETAEAALRRELQEELELAPRAARLFTELHILLPFAPPRRHRMTFFAVPLDWRDLDAMVQHEGAGRRLFTATALAAEPLVAPWDAAAVLMHARSGVRFAPPARE